MTYRQRAADKTPECQLAECVIALGGNVGDVPRSFTEVAEELRRAGCEVSRVSSIYRTAPVGSDAGDTYWNGAMLLRSPFDPASTLRLLHEIEGRLGRVRETHWGPRTIDLDLIVMGDCVLNLPHITLPHPACWYRRFVLDPVVEIAGDIRHPLADATFSELRQRLLDRPLAIACGGPDAPVLERTLRLQFPTQIVIVQPAEDPTILFTATSIPGPPHAARPQPGRFALPPVSGEALATAVLKAALDEPRPIVE
ncbi:MAG: 2-amino-4-hydroxy-6-hydroxymethyldihydropteridine diphosphokinase [Planctomycetaceae bacterium]